MAETQLPLSALSAAVDWLFDRQMAVWPAVRQSYAALDCVQTRQLQLHGVSYRLQHNPARVRSSAARVDRQSVAARPCFLCLPNRPKEQMRLSVLGRYEVLVNPFPIFPRHLTIVSADHCPQAIARVGQGLGEREMFAPLRDLLLLAKALPAYTLFYNGPRSGASAPDHMHFQAGSRGMMPIEQGWRGRIREKWTLYERGWQRVADDHTCLAPGRASFYRLDDAPRHALVVESADLDAVVSLFAHVCRTLQGRDPILQDCKQAEPSRGRILPDYSQALQVQTADPSPACTQHPEGNEEPMLNLLALYDDNHWTLFIFPRRAHRPSCYSLQGDDRMLISPASVDLGGLFVLPVEADFRRMDAEKLERILQEVCMDCPLEPWQ